MGIVYHETFGKYDLGPGHPFRGDRFVDAMHFFEEQGLFRLPHVVMFTPKPVTKRDLLRVHDEKYVDLLFRLAEKNRPYDIETPVSPQILEAAQLMVGGAVEAGKAIYERKVNRVVALGCGHHHAGRDYGGGFCLFNDVAVLVEWLREKYGLKRALIFDYDVHFGNGTSDIYYTDPSVLFISLHQSLGISNSGGFVEMIGDGEGEGYNVNVPLPPGTGNETYIKVLREVFVPLAEEFNPELIIASGGSDAHFRDMLGTLSLTVDGFFALSRTIVKVAEKVSGGRLILTLCSGYNPKVVPLCWYALTAGIVGLETINMTELYTPPVEPLQNRQKVEVILSNLKRMLKKYWKCFS